MKINSKVNPADNKNSCSRDDSKKSKSYSKLIKEKDFEIEKLQAQLAALKNIYQLKPTQFSSNKALNSLNRINNNASNYFDSKDYQSSSTTRIKSSSGKLGNNSIFKFDSKLFGIDKFELYSERPKFSNSIRNKGTIDNNNNNNNISNANNKSGKGMNSNNMLSNNSKNLLGMFNSNKRNFSATFSNFFRKANNNNNKKHTKFNSSDNYSLIKECMQNNFNSIHYAGEDFDRLAGK